MLGARGNAQLTIQLLWCSSQGPRITPTSPALTSPTAPFRSIKHTTCSPNASPPIVPEFDCMASDRHSSVNVSEGLRPGTNGGCEGEDSSSDKETLLSVFS